MSKLMTLEEWARRRYESPPCHKTLLRWVSAAKIVPLPKKEGRAYVVQENAEYVDPSDPSYYDKLARAHESTQAQ